jgi:hypothetical protein
LESIGVPGLIVRDAPEVMRPATTARLQHARYGPGKRIGQHK